MQKNDTAPGLTTILLRILRKFLDHQTESLNSWNFDKERQKSDFEELVRDQKTLGWHCLFQGRLCTKWKDIQRKHYDKYTDEDKHPAYKTAQWWTAGVIQQLIYFSLNTWQIRNDHLHKDRVEQASNKLRSDLQTEMDGWYRHAETLGAPFDKYF